MKKIEIDLPLGQERNELEVICKASKNYDERFAGEKLYEVLKNMPISTLHHVFEKPGFQMIYRAYSDWKSHHG